MSNCGMYRRDRRTQGKGRMPKGLWLLTWIPGGRIKSSVTVIERWRAARKDVPKTEHTGRQCVDLFLLCNSKL